MEILSKSTGWIIIIIYLISMLLISFIYSSGRKKTKLYYFVSNRSISKNIGAFSIAITWIWAPALFIASEKAYTQGILGVFWFTVPNILTLIIFGFFAEKLRAKIPQGWTFAGFIKDNYSKRVHSLFLVENFGLQILSFAVQILAGASIISRLTGISFLYLSIAFGIMPFLYTIRNGIKSSIMTDYWQMFWILAVIAVGIPIVINSTSLTTVIKGFNGLSGNYGNFFSKESLEVFLTFGIPVTIGLLSGPFGDQMFWQRAFSIKEKDVKSAFIRGALIFGIVPIGLAFLGFSLAGMNIKIQDTQLSNLEAIINFTPKWFIYPFVIMILSGLLSTADSIVCAVSSLVGNDVLQRIENKRNIFFSEKQVINISRLSMVAVAIIGISIANISGIKILYLFLIYGILRASVLLPTIYAIKEIKMSDAGLFWGILVSIFVGLPVFAYGKLYHINYLIIVGSLLALLGSGIISLFRKK